MTVLVHQVAPVGDPSNPIILSIQLRYETSRRDIKLEGTNRLFKLASCYVHSLISTISDVNLLLRPETLEHGAIGLYSRKFIFHGPICIRNG